MKKFAGFLAALLAGLALTACGGDKGGKGGAKAGAADKVIRVGATPMPHAEILEVVRGQIEAAGFKLEIVEFNDYVTPNLATESGDLDANFFQHTPYLNEFNAQKGTHLVEVAGVHLEPMAAYSKRIKSLGELKSGDVIAVPNDPTNENRALDLLARLGLIELDGSVALRTAAHVTKNPHGLVIRELDGPTLPRALDDVTLAVINTNFAKNIGLNPSRDGLAIESSEGNPYVNVLVVKAGKERDSKTLTLAKALQSDAVKAFLMKKYDGEIIPAF